MDDVIEGEIADLAFGGQGILRHAGFVIFVPYAAPGDKVSCRITKLKKNYAEAEILTVLKKSPFRAIPVCPYYGICGGCQLQHITYASQLDQKQKWVKESLERIGSFKDIQVLPTIKSEKEWAYRRHVQLTLKTVERGYEVGYIGTDNRSLVQVKECSIFGPKEQKVLHHLQEVVSQLKPKDREPARVNVMKEKEQEGTYIVHFHFKELPVNAREVFANALSHGWVGVIAGSQKESLTFGRTEAHVTIGNLKFCFASDVFMQNNPEQSVNIYRHIEKIVLESKARYVLDLYCGIGVTSAIIASHGVEVHGMEYSHKAVKLAIRNAQQNQLSQVTFQQGAVEALLEKSLKHKVPDVLIVNPPREGLDGRVIESIVSFKPERLIYVSCMPATLARDLRLLSEHYRVVECQPYDMFPQTAHIETLVVLEKVSVK